MNDEGFTLAIPFVVVSSAGGPFDDDAYTAGYEAGMTHMLLAQQAPILEGGLTIHTTNVPQVDLMAMASGYTMEAEPYHEHPEWSIVRFTLIDEDASV